MKTTQIQGKLLDLNAHREFAKVGVGVSLGLAAVTALNLKDRTFRRLHTLSGIALVGFGIYHYGLYNNGFIQRYINNARKAKRLKVQKTDEKF
ncbi:MAG: helicase [Campylobacter sp.]|nr:helicase [Campylobacter sp.]